MSFGFPKNSPYIKIFDYHIQRLRETGAMKKLFPKFPAQECPDLSGKPIGFESITSGFLILAIGIGISLIIMLFEFIKNTVGGKSKHGQPFEQRNGGKPDIQDVEVVEQDSSDNITVVECH